jgi:formylglycine-generating enzyme required for sulfatase activity
MKLPRLVLFRTVGLACFLAFSGISAVRGQTAPPAVTPATGSLVIQCPMACRISIPELGVKDDAPKDHLQLASVPAGTYTATFSAFNRQLSHTFVITAGQATHLTVNIAQGKVREGGAEPPAEARSSDPASASLASGLGKSAKPADPFSAPRFVIPEVGITMIAVAPASFIMGTELGNKIERPPMRVTLTRRYWLSQTEVTQAQWLTLMETNPSKVPGPDLPVESVSWMGAMEFCQRLTKHERAAGHLPEGYFYILPFEAQWEYACLAGGEGRLEDELKRVGWYQSNSGGHVHPVGQLVPNAWGFDDMRGNVAEWCFDWLGAYPGGMTADYAGPATGTQRVIRGGAYDMIAFCCRASFRSGEAPDKTHPNVGFRLALFSVPPKAAKAQ